VIGVDASARGLAMPGAFTHSSRVAEMALVGGRGGTSAPSGTCCPRVPPSYQVEAEEVIKQDKARRET
jgi:hypothetical protein